MPEGVAVDATSDVGLVQCLRHVKQCKIPNICGWVDARTPKPPTTHPPLAIKGMGKLAMVVGTLRTCLTMCCDVMHRALCTTTQPLSTQLCIIRNMHVPTPGCPTLARWVATDAPVCVNVDALGDAALLSKRTLVVAVLADVRSSRHRNWNVDTVNKIKGYYNYFIISIFIFINKIIYFTINKLFSFYKSSE
jgi:hypothetical protein